MTKAYLDKGWKVIAAVRDTSKMPKVEGDIVVVKLEVGEKEDAKKVCLLSAFVFRLTSVLSSFRSPWSISHWAVTASCAILIARL